MITVRSFGRCFRNEKTIYLIHLYWDIGRRIVEKQETLGWGEAVIDRMSQDLMDAFPGTSGFSPRNLRNMKRFHLAYADPDFWRQAVAKFEPEFLQQLVEEIPWGHYLTMRFSG